MTTTITIVRACIVLGQIRAAGAQVASVPVNEAAALVWRGDATYTNGAPTQSVEIDPTVFIESAQVADTTAVGRGVMTAASTGAAQTALGAGATGAAVFGAATFDALLTAMGATLGAANSGGTGYKAIVVPNATT